MHVLEEEGELPSTHFGKGIGIADNETSVTPKALVSSVLKAENLIGYVLFILSGTLFSGMSCGLQNSSRNLYTYLIGLKGSYKLSARCVLTWRFRVIGGTRMPPR